MHRAARIVLFTAILALPLGFAVSHVMASSPAKKPKLCSTKHVNTVNCTVDQGTRRDLFVFKPQFISVKVGVTVTWMNVTKTITHTTTSDPGDLDTWDSGFMSPGQTFAHTFQNAGKAGYHCSIHGAPGSGMYGTITVTS